MRSQEEYNLKFPQYASGPKTLYHAVIANPKKLEENLYNVYMFAQSPDEALAKATHARGGSILASLLVIKSLNPVQGDLITEEEAVALSILHDKYRKSLNKRETNDTSK